MKTAYNKTLIIMFRICIFATFFTGLMYVVKFVGDPGKGGRAEAVAAVSGFFYAYLVFVLASLVLSILCFKTTSTVSAVVRTFSLAATAVILFLNMSFINLMNNALKVSESGDYEQVMELNAQAKKIARDAAIMDKALLSLASVFVMFVLTVTSVVALIRALKGKAESADAK